MTRVDYNAFTQQLMADIREHGRPTSGPMAGRPLMILNTLGARSGEPRSAVVTYTRDGDSYVIAASKSGFTSPGLDGVTTFSPGTWAKSASRHWECCAPAERTAPSELRRTSGTRTCPPNI